MAIRVFFFFKQKTAYERRISDWSSDVCSSDLPTRHLRRCGRVRPPRSGRVRSVARRSRPTTGLEWPGVGPPPPAVCRTARRSEEHTSELQSLMRISYAVFCLKKQKKSRETIKSNTNNINTTTTMFTTTLLQNKDTI